MKFGTVIDPKKEKLWRGRLEQWQRSGLSVQKFCRQKKLIPHQFYYWRRRLGADFAFHDLGSVAQLVARMLQTDVEDFRSLQPLCEDMLKQKQAAVGAIERFARTVRRFRQRLCECRDHIEWAKGAPALALSAEDVARVWGTEAGFIRELVLKALPPGNYVKVLLGLPGRWCPLCRRDLRPKRQEDSGKAFGQGSGQQNTQGKEKHDG